MPRLPARGVPCGVPGVVLPLSAHPCPRLPAAIRPRPRNRRRRVLDRPLLRRRRHPAALRRRPDGGGRPGGGSGPQRGARAVRVPRHLAQRPRVVPARVVAARRPHRARPRGRDEEGGGARRADGHDARERHDGGGGVPGARDPQPDAQRGQPGGWRDRVADDADAHGRHRVRDVELGRGARPRRGARGAAAPAVADGGQHAAERLQGRGGAGGPEPRARAVVARRPRRALRLPAAVGRGDPPRRARAAPRRHRQRHRVARDAGHDPPRHGPRRGLRRALRADWQVERHRAEPPHQRARARRPGLGAGLARRRRLPAPLVPAVLHDDGGHRRFRRGGRRRVGLLELPGGHAGRAEQVRGPQDVVGVLVHRDRRGVAARRVALCGRRVRPDRAGLRLAIRQPAQHTRQLGR
mmetsp:Transcript_28739/g.99133  ORF Transcript_28739/g.99133 Transcript_28739/m.99133 type:complete len:410 (-) Transcript_28739:1009-2238(-)